MRLNFDHGTIATTRVGKPGAVLRLRKLTISNGAGLLHPVEIGQHFDLVAIRPQQPGLESVVILRGGDARDPYRWSSCPEAAILAVLVENCSSTASLQHPGNCATPALSQFCMAASSSHFADQSCACSTRRHVQQEHARDAPPQPCTSSRPGHSPKSRHHFLVYIEHDQRHQHVLQEYRSGRHVFKPLKVRRRMDVACPTVRRGRTHRPGSRLYQWCRGMRTFISPKPFQCGVVGPKVS